jgi:hypothetical protein
MKRLATAAAIAVAALGATAPVAGATTEAQAEATFRAYARGHCGIGTRICLQMGPAYCSTRVRGYTFDCATNWLETSWGRTGFRTQIGQGRVFQGLVVSFNAYTTSGS